MIGNVIDKYEVLQKLGEGATATVYRGRHMSIGKDVAIKVLHPHLSASSRYRERFNREARAVGRLSHQNIVSILDYSGQQTDDCYIVTELVDGVTLLALLEEHGPLPSEIVAMIGIELAIALSFAHKAGIIHRDLKPENVMIRRDGVVKLMDFGVARVLDEGQITLDGSLLGSPAYMSPQQAVDEKLDGRSDLFSLGTVLFHVVTGHIPFAGSNASIILRNIIDANRAEVLELAPQAAPALAGVIDRLLQTRPEDRYDTAEAVEAALHAVLAESGVSPAHPVLNLRSWLHAPGEVTAALNEHLRVTLLERGKARIAENDTVGALQLFNRLLAVDENHPEVLALLQSLHAPPPKSGSVGRIATLAALALLSVGAGAYWLYPRAKAPPAPVAVAEPAARPEPETSEPAPEEAPAAEAAPEPEPPATAPSSPESVKLAVRPAPGTEKLASMARVAEAPSGPAFVTLELQRPAEVFIDGVSVGRFREGPADRWVGTRQRPIQVPAGAHTIELRNPGAEPFREEFTVAPGENYRVTASLKRLNEGSGGSGSTAGKTTRFLVNPNLPRDCTLTVGSTPYGTIAQFKGVFELASPEPRTRVLVQCGDRKAEFPLPASAGVETIIPAELPPGLVP